jgi:hypothetical protein
MVVVNAQQEQLKQERDYSLFAARKEVRKLERELIVNPENRTANAALRSIAYMLLQLAQKYVPNTTGAFADHSDLVYCIKLLQEMGFKPEITSKFDSAVSSVSLNVIRNSFEYRQLRNKIKACLAVIADLTDRPAAAGTQDYQKGIREGYRRASDIAVLFLEDINENL